MGDVGFGLPVSARPTANRTREPHGGAMYLLGRNTISFLTRKHVSLQLISKMSSLTYTLPSGTKIPVPSYGVGTAWYKAKPGDLNRELIDSIKTAISVGYTHFDNAEVYNNEEEMGEAVAESKTPREKLYITTKVLPGIADIPGALKTSLKKLQTDYVDLYLIHSHNFAGKEGKPSLKEAWKKMEDLKDQGLVREIGVSNYSVESLKEIMKDAKHPPVANQVSLCLLSDALRLEVIEPTVFMIPSPKPPCEEHY